MTIILERVKILNILVNGQTTIDEIIKKADLQSQEVQKHINTLLKLEMIEKKVNGENIM
jgi:predicted transcriptional regulator